jgi:1,4-alpha-glucan branching enzyme
VSARRTAAPRAVLDPGDAFLGEQDLYLFNEGSHVRLYEKLGAHPGALEGVEGTYFAVWAPSAERLSVVGEFNNWHGGRHRLRPRGSSGIWEGFVPKVGHGALYKFRIAPRDRARALEKADPFAFACELPPKTASLVWDLDYEWSDASWMAERGRANALEAPISVYELHAGSWRRVPK